MTTEVCINVLDILIAVAAFALVSLFLKRSRLK